jgi:large subunit ribosomal protein L18
MLTQTSKNQNRRHVHERIRKKILGTADRPRLNVYRSLNHIYVQLIDDLQGTTLVSANSAEGKKGERRIGGNLAAAKTVGKNIAERGGYIYHGRVKALADSAREAGLQF